MNNMNKRIRKPWNSFIIYKSMLNIVISLFRYSKLNSDFMLDEIKLTLNHVEQSRLIV